MNRATAVPLGLAASCADRIALQLGMVPNLHSVAMSVGVLCVRCKACGRRGVDKKQLPDKYASMTQLRELRFWFQQCNSRGTPIGPFELYIPHDFDEAKAFLAGEPLEIRKIKA